MNAEERTDVREVLNIVDAIGKNASRRIVDAMFSISYIIEDLNKTHAKLKEALVMLEDLPERKRKLYHRLEKGS